MTKILNPPPPTLLLKFMYVHFCTHKFFHLYTKTISFSAVGVVFFNQMYNYMTQLYKNNNKALLLFLGPVRNVCLERYCRYGYVLDKYGCSTCACKCEWFYVIDQIFPGILFSFKQLPRRVFFAKLFLIFS